MHLRQQESNLSTCRLELRLTRLTSDVAVFNSPSCVLMTDGDDPQTYPATIGLGSRYSAN